MGYVKVLVVVMVALIGAASWPGSVRAQSASGCQGCKTSSTCESSGLRAGCYPHCDQRGICYCIDGKCEPTLLTLELQPGQTTYRGQGAGLEIANGTFLVANCRGEIAGVAYTAQTAIHVAGKLRDIQFVPAFLQSQVASGQLLRRFRGDAYTRNSALLQ